jgi:hypothetical protein
MRSLSVLCLVALAISASASTIEEVSQDLRKASECMVNVLNTIPNVENAHIEISTKDYSYPPMKSWPHPVVEYSYPDRAEHEKIEIHFEAMRGDDPPYFQATMGGLFDGSKYAGPDMFGSEIIIPKWKEECHIRAGVFTI